MAQREPRWLIQRMQQLETLLASMAARAQTPRDRLEDTGPSGAYEELLQLEYDLDRARELVRLVSNLTSIEISQKAGGGDGA